MCGVITAKVVDQFDVRRVQYVNVCCVVTEKEDVSSFGIWWI